MSGLLLGTCHAVVVSKLLYLLPYSTEHCRCHDLHCCSLHAETVVRRVGGRAAWLKFPDFWALITVKSYSDKLWRGGMLLSLGLELGESPRERPGAERATHSANLVLPLPLTALVPSMCLGITHRQYCPYFAANETHKKADRVR